ncbi:MAG: DJ-1/PfpI family protein [Tahibacter sp.]
MKQREIWFVVPPNLVLLDFAGAADAFRIAVAKGADFRLRFATATGATTTTSLGLSLSGLEPLPESVGEGAVVIVCGASSETQLLASRAGRDLIAWLRRVRPGEAGTLACVCAGALIAAQAGLLDGRRCTTHHTLIEALRREAPRAQVLDSRVFVQDGSIYTSAGITAGIDLALYLIAQLSTPRLSVEVARELVVYLRRAADDPALSPWLEGRNHMDARVHAVQDRLLRAPQEDWSLQQLASLGNMSVRTLTRRFRESVGASVHDYQLRLRVALARQAIETGATVELAAQQSGLGSARQLRRVWGLHAAGSPSAARRL